MKDGRVQVVTKYNMAAFLPKEDDYEESVFTSPVKEERPSHEGKVRTVNKFNKAAFMPKDENLFKFGGGGDFFKHQNGGTYGGTSMMTADNTFNVPLPGGSTFTFSSANYQKPVLTDSSGYTKQLGGAGEVIKSTQNAPSSGSNGFFGKGGAGTAAAGALLGVASSIGQSETNKRGLFDVMDPVHQLAGGRESAVGNALGDAGVGVFQAGVSTGNPWIMAAGAGLKVIGGLTNAAFGIKEDKEKKAAADASIASNQNFMSNAESFDDIKGPASATATDVYEGGWFSGGKADRKNAELARRMANAYSWADRSILNNVQNLQDDQVENFLRNYSAFGGYLTRPKRKRKVKR